LELDKTDGYFNMVQYGRLDIPVAIMRKFGVFKGWFVNNYKEGKKAFLSIPKEKRRFPYVSASRVVVMFPSDATEEEVLDALQFLVSDLKRRWKREDY